VKNQKLTSLQAKKLREARDLLRAAGTEEAKLRTIFAALYEREAERLARSMNVEKRRAIQRAKAEARERRPPPPPNLVFSAFESNRRRH